MKAHRGTSNAMQGNLQQDARVELCVIVRTGGRYSANQALTDTRQTSKSVLHLSFM